MYAFKNHLSMDATHVALVDPVILDSILSVFINVADSSYHKQEYF